MGRDALLNYLWDIASLYMSYIPFQWLASGDTTECRLGMIFITCCIVKLDCYVDFCNNFLVLIVANDISHLVINGLLELGGLWCNYYVRLFWSHIKNLIIFTRKNNVPCTFFCISKCHTCHCEVWWKIHIINHLFFPCFSYVYTVSVVIIQCRENIPSWIAIGGPIQAVCGFYICNHTYSRVSSWIF